ncbi:MAG: PIN domain-containing protein [Anaerolineales bacterium]
MSNDKCFIDSTFFLHYLTNDIPEFGDQIDDLILQAGKGEIQLITNSLVIVELVWTLEYAYHLSRADIQRKILAILNTPGLVIHDMDILFRASYLYTEKQLDFLAAYHQAWLELVGIGCVARFQNQPFPKMEIAPVSRPAFGIDH